MNAISPLVWFEPDDARRASQRHERWSLGRENKGGGDGHGSSARRLIAHFATTTSVFVALASFVWLASWIFRLLHSVSPFSEEQLEILGRLKLVLLYLDILMSGVVLLGGVYRYIVTVLQGDP